ncbi:MAG: hypothetical protein K2N21_00930 [Rikenellaceae bacterium]|nr:hypothetical protein [Rikenellaceae bacterium]
MPIVKHITIFVSALICLFATAGATAASESTTRDNDSAYDRKGRIKIAASSFKEKRMQALDYYLRGVQSLEQGDGEKALALFETALECDSLHAPSSYRISTLLADKEEALRQARRAWSLDSANFWYASQTGALLTQMGRYDQAIEVWRYCRDLKPDDIQIHQYIAALYNVRGQTISAIATIDTALMRFVDDLELLEYRGELLAAAYRPREVIANAQRMLALAPDNARYMALLAQGHASAGADTLAAVCFKRAIARDSTDLEVLINAAMFYENTNNVTDYLDVLNMLMANDKIALEDKLAYFGQLMDNIPLYRKYIYNIERLLNTLRLYHADSYSVDRLYARHLTHIGRASDALDIFKARCRDADDKISLDAYMSIISMESYLKRPDSVALYARTAMERFTQDTDLPLLYAVTLHERSEHKEAVSVVKKRLKSIRTDSIRSIYHGFIGDMEQQTGRMRQCYKQYDKALSYNPDNINVLNNYSYFLSLEGRDLDRALAMSSRVLKAEPSNATYIDTYGWILYKSGLYKEARTYLLKAIALDENPSAELLTHYGDVLYKLGEKTNAAIYWHKALKAGGDKEMLEKRIKEGLE